MLLRSYDIEDHSDLLSDGFPLWGACRATSAATSYFEPFAHGNLRFVDGAFANNNPVFQVMIEAEAMWKDRQMMLVSIGTGNAAGKSLDGGAYSLLRTLPKLVTQTENTADQFYDSHQDMVDRDQYFRFTVDGLGVVGLGDYKMVNAIESETLHYLRQGPIGRRLKKCMESLLDRSPKGKGSWTSSPMPRGGSFVLFSFSKYSRETDVNVLLQPPQLLSFRPKSQVPHFKKQVCGLHIGLLCKGTDPRN